jgi:hypothetical protein
METKIGRIKYKKRVSKYPDYYKPTPECSYKVRKTNIKNIPKLVKTTGKFVINFD